MIEGVGTLLVNLFVIFYFICMKLIANLQDEKTPYGTKGGATQYARG
ncbi:BQ2448_4973 [Microbotryum intermedium]|uniref:BQ2448_4973 protein n=1 Tax=Microbotryum intermedium TaxID=269621 RepID=A0A238FHK6_9BASI|nr:BQ2448_4973 [Microbotryum intermedium]